MAKGDNKDKLTTLQRKFVVNLVSGMTQRQAYLDAGGKAKTENTQDSSSSEILSNPKVRSFYDKLMEEAASAAVLTREEALLILSNNAKVKMSDVADFSFQCVGKDEEGQDIMQTVWQMKDSKDIDIDVMAAIKSITMTKEGPKIELHDQHGAIKQLSAMQGWDSAKKHDVVVDMGLTLKFDEQDEDA